MLTFGPGFAEHADATLKSSGFVSRSPTLSARFPDITRFLAAHEPHGVVTYRVRDQGETAGVLILLDCPCGFGFVASMPRPAAQDLRWPPSVRAGSERP